MYDYDLSRCDIDTFIYTMHYAFRSWQTRTNGASCADVDKLEGLIKNSRLPYDVPRYRISLNARGRMNITI